MMYHFEVSCGESPDLATVKEAPLESKVGLPCGVKESDGPLAKSTETDVPKAGSAGQLPKDTIRYSTWFAPQHGKRTACKWVAGRVSLGRYR